MTAPARRAAPTVTATAATSTLSGISVQQGDLVVVTATGGDSAPGITLTPTNCTLEDSAFTGGGGADEDVRAAEVADSFYVHIWSARVETASAGATVAISASPWTTGSTRRLSVIVINPGTGRAWDVRANRLASTGTLSETSGLSPRFTSNWSPSPPSNPIAGVLGVYKSGTTNSALDWDDDTTFDENVASGSIGGGTFYFPGDSTSTGSKMADAYWDAGAANRPIAGHGVRMSLASGGKAAAAVLYKTIPASVTLATATETDTAQAVAHSRALAAGVATEVDTAQAVTKGQHATATTATEVDTAQAVTYQRAAPAGLATEVDTAQTISRAFPAGNTDVTAALATETDVALALTWEKVATFESVLDDPGNGPYSSYVLRAWAWKTHDGDVGDVRFALKDGASFLQTGPWVALTTTPTAIDLPITATLSGWSNLRAWWQTRTSSQLDANVGPVELQLDDVLGTAIETDEAQPAAPYKTDPNVSAGPAAEVDTALAVAAARALATALATETDDAGTIDHALAATLGPAIETDLAQPVAAFVPGVPSQGVVVLIRHVEQPPVHHVEGRSF